MTVIALPAQSWIDRLGPIDGAEFVAWDLTGEPPRREAIEIIAPPYRMHSEGLDRLCELPNLRHVQLLTAGYEHAAPFVPPGASLANAAGVHDAATAELAVTLTLAAQRSIPDLVLAQHRGEWISLGFRPGLADKRVLIVGYGRIGAAIARRLAPFEVALTAVATRAREGDQIIPRVHGLEDLPALLSEQDIVILILPLTPTSTRLVDAGFLAAMKPGALLVNVARGKVVDTGALIEACRSGRVRAALDVTDPEPLPPGHPLFDTPGVLVVPHVGGPTDAFFPRAADLLRGQIRAYLDGTELVNLVTDVRGQDG
ncbi:MAG TPA: 2-hydroxyacid dehydrogenase [Dermatophilaceae bacterium]|nr:2-hydroxyacid dehydrogenase [Dermatophilaceae bacterium]